MATATKQTSLDKVQSIAVENGWNVHVGRATVTIKDPAPADGIGYGYRRRWVPRVQVEVWEVTVDNLDALADTKYQGVSYGQCKINVYFTDEGKYLAEVTKSTNYQLYADKPLREVLRVLEQLAPAQIQAHALTRINQDAAHRERKIGEAQARYDEALMPYSKARQEAAGALRRLGLTDEQMCEVLDALDSDEGALTEFVAAAMTLRLRLGQVQSARAEKV